MSTRELFTTMVGVGVTLFLLRSAWNFTVGAVMGYVFARRRANLEPGACPLCGCDGMAHADPPDPPEVKS